MRMSAAVVLCSVFVGCGGKTEQTEPTPSDIGSLEEAGDDGWAARDGATDDVSEVDAPTSDAAGSSCNEIVNSGVVVQPVDRPEAPPTPRGGPLGNGTYELVSSVTYTGPGGLSGARGQSLQLTVQVSGTKLEVVQKLGAAKDAHGSATLALAGSRLTMTYGCPTTYTAPWDGYDASIDHFVLYNSKIGLALSFVKKP